jgi:hypothetical protein
LSFSSIWSQQIIADEHIPAHKIINIHNTSKKGVSITMETVVYSTRIVWHPTDGFMRVCTLQTRAMSSCQLFREDIKIDQIVNPPLHKTDIIQTRMGRSWNPAHTPLPPPYTYHPRPSSSTQVSFLDHLYFGLVLVFINDLLGKPLSWELSSRVSLGHGSSLWTLIKESWG